MNLDKIDILENKIFNIFLMCQYEIKYVWRIDKLILDARISFKSNRLLMWFDT